MFINDKLIYVELHKTGCTQIRTLLMEHAGGVLTNKHNLITHHSQSVPIVGSIRNPWDWHVSLWAYGCNGEGRCLNQRTAPDSWAFKLVPSNDTTKQKKKWNTVFSDPMDPKKFRTWLSMVYDPKYKADVYPLYAQSSISEFAGLLTFRYICLSTPWSKLFKKEKSGGFTNIEELDDFLDENNIWSHVIRTESIPSDLIRILEDTGHRLSPQTKELIPFLSQRRINLSIHNDSSLYYDEESKALVANREQIIVERFGYPLPTAIL